MNIKELNHGQTTVVEVCRTDGSPFDEVSADTNFAELIFGGERDQFILKINDKSWLVDGCDLQKENILRELARRNRNRLTWIAARFGKEGEKAGITSILLQVHEFLDGHQLSDPLEMGIDEKTFEDLFRKRSGLHNKREDALKYLQDEFLLKPANAAEPVFMVVSGIRDYISGTSGGFRIYGRTTVADIGYGKTGSSYAERPYIKKMTKLQKSSQENERPLLLLKGQMSFVDVTVSKSFSSHGKKELEQIVSTGSSYLALWEY